MEPTGVATGDGVRPTTPVAGWYPDPSNPAATRWWDGTAWTASVNLTQPAATPVPGAAEADGKGPLLAVSGWLLAFLGLVFAVVGLAGANGVRSDAALSATAPGVVTAVTVGRQIPDRPPGTDNQITCALVATFQVDGRPYLSAPPASVRPSGCPWTVGQGVSIRYDPAAPLRSRIVTDDSEHPWSDVLVYLLFAVVGLGLLVVGLLVVFKPDLVGARIVTGRTAQR